MLTTPHRVLLSFPTRRSSDLSLPQASDQAVMVALARVMAISGNAHTRLYLVRNRTGVRRLPIRTWWLDRKSTRLNSSHLVISYAVFCLRKKIKRIWRTTKKDE